MRTFDLHLSIASHRDPGFGSTSALRSLGALKGLLEPSKWIRVKVHQDQDEGSGSSNIVSC